MEPKFSKLRRSGARIGCDECDVSHEPFECQITQEEQEIIDASGYEDWDFDEEEEMDWILQNNKFQKYIEELVAKRTKEELEKLKIDAERKKKLSQSTMNVAK